MNFVFTYFLFEKPDKNGRTELKINLGFSKDILDNCLPFSFIFLLCFLKIYIIDCKYNKLIIIDYI